jgi:hypothetical protein
MHSLLDRCRYTLNLNGSALQESQIDLSQLVAKVLRRSRRRLLGATHAEGTSA